MLDACSEFENSLCDLSDSIKRVRLDSLTCLVDRSALPRLVTPRVVCFQISYQQNDVFVLNMKSHWILLYDTQMAAITQDVTML